MLQQSANNPTRRSSMRAETPLVRARIFSTLLLFAGVGCGGAGGGGGTGGGPAASGGRSGGGGSTATGGNGSGGAPNSGTGGAATGGSSTSSGGASTGGTAGGSGGHGQGGRDVGLGSGGAAGGTTGSGGAAGAGSGGRAGTGGSGMAGAGGASEGIAFDPPDGVFAVATPVDMDGATQMLALRNRGGAPVMVSALAISGTDAARFTVVAMPALPATIAAGAALELAVHFMPPSGSGTTMYTGALTATLSGAGTARAGLYALVLSSSNAEPSLDTVVKTLGYAINVGGTTITLGTGAAAIGDEVLVKRFVKAPGATEVRLEPVARYAPFEAAPYGYYTGTAPNVTRTMLATMSRGPTDNVANRTLFPPLDAGGSLTFDPGAMSFGVYAESMMNRSSVGDDARFYLEDSLNNDQGSVLPVHRMRVYPVKNRAGQAVPNTYLVACEEASNSDYQDYVFLISNVTPAPN